MQSFRKDAQALGITARIVATDASPLTAAGQGADVLHIVPPVAAASYSKAVIELCLAEGVNLLVPTIDTELRILARLRERLADLGTHALISSPTAIELSLDKAATHEFLCTHDLPCPLQWTPHAARRDAARLPYPLLVKPRTGSASKGIRIIPDQASLADFPPQEDDVLQEVVRGDEYTVDLWADRDGQVREAVARRRIDVRGGEVSKAITVRHKAVIELARRVVESLPGAYGPITVQLFADGSALHVIEINARFGGGFPLSWQAGARYPRWAMQDALGEPMSPRSFSWANSLVMLRYDEAYFVSGGEVGLE